MKYLVVGLKKSGVGAIKLLLKNGEEVFAFDKDKEVVKNLFAKNCDEKFKKLKKNNEKFVILKKLSAKNIKNIDIVVLSPGVFSKKLDALFKKYNKKVISELELASKFCKAPILAITGTNGKTTTVSLLFEMFKNVNKKTCLVGNVGISFCEKVFDGNMDLAICEASSFQLEKVENFSPQIVGFLNICDDHLDRYNSFDEYFKAKQNIFKNFTETNIAVFNYDDRKLFDFSKTISSRKYYFSLKTLPDDLFGAYILDEQIVFKLCKSEFKLNLCEISLLGEHNLYNVMCAGLMALLYGLSFENVKKAIKNFMPPKHRIEFVKKVDGVSFYDDSKGTNIASTLSAVNCFKEKILLMLGGEDKNENFNNFFSKLPKNVSRILCFGRTKRKILKSAKKCGFKNITVCKNMKDAFNFFNTKQMEESVVLLSPACSSFDQFSSYEERGNYFKSLVWGLKNEI